MNPFFKLTYFLLFLTLGIWACEKDETLPQPQPQNKLEAKAGADQQVVAGTPVNLDGSASKDGNGKAFTYAWTFKSKPSTSAVSLSGFATATPSFTPDVAGTYVVELKISNDLGFAADEVSITATGTDQPNPTSAIIISQNITEDRVLEDIFTDAAKADYIVTADVLVTAKLTIKPGVRVEFEQDKGLTILGALVAKGLNDATGTHEKRITFAGKTASRGFWKGIFIISNNPLNELEYVTMAHAGSSSFVDLPYVKASVALLGSENSGAALKISGTTIVESAGYGLYVQGMSELTKFENNSFSDNSGSAVYVPARQLHKLDFFSHFTGNNGFDGVETGGELAHSTEVQWPDFNDGSGYYVSTDLTVKSGVRIQEGATFTFREGLVLRVTDGGHLNATGSEASKITFTAHTKTGQLNWGGIQFQTTSDQNKLHYAEVSYAGNKEIPFYPGLKANVAVAQTAKVSIENSAIEHGLGWGLLGYTDKGAQINANVTAVNSFHTFQSGYYRLTFADPNVAQLTGTWLDETSFINQYAFDAKLYDREANRWFGGASDPFTKNPRPGIGLKINADGSYIWTILMAHDPVGECGVPYSAEYFTGTATATGQQLQFQENFWRSKFVNPCDASQNVDTNITPGSMTLSYKIDRLHNTWTGEAFWQLSITAPDGEIIVLRRK